MQIRAPIMEKLERMLASWIEHHRALPLSPPPITAIERDPKMPPFASNAGWFERFIVRHSFKLAADFAAAATFNGYYLRKTFAQLVMDTDGEDQVPLKDFWRNLNIKKAAEKIGQTRAGMRQSCMDRVWRKIWPDAVAGFRGFEPEEISSSRPGMLDLRSWLSPV
jgi:hypothetical protein